MDGKPGYDIACFWDNGDGGDTNSSTIANQHDNKGTLLISIKHYYRIRILVRCIRSLNNKDASPDVTKYSIIRMLCLIF